MSPTNRTHAAGLAGLAVLLLLAEAAPAQTFPPPNPNMGPVGTSTMHANSSSSGVIDPCAIADGAVADCNGNEISDSCDIGNGVSSDVDGDLIPMIASPTATVTDCQLPTSSPTGLRPTATKMTPRTAVTSHRVTRRTTTPTASMAPATLPVVI